MLERRNQCYLPDKVRNQKGVGPIKQVGSPETWERKRPYSRIHYSYSKIWFGYNAVKFTSSITLRSYSNAR